MADISFDVSEVRTFAADMTRIPPELSKRAAPILAKGALNIKEQLRQEMSASASFGFLARSITYDLDTDGERMEAEIGPVKTSGGKTGHHKGANIAYFGTWKGGGTVPDPRGALEAEAPAFERELAALAEEVWR